MKRIIIMYIAEKQNKILNKINFNVGNTSKVPQKAKKNPNDEFYTSLQDIMNELSHYGEHLRGKDVICPCDWDIFADEDVFSIRIDF